MYIVTDKNGMIIAISNSLSYQKNGNPLVYDDSLAIDINIVGEVSEIEKVPEIVKEYEYTYVGGVFEPYTPKPEYPTDIKLKEMQDIKIKEISDICDNTIYSGIDVTTSQGLEHFSLTTHDQIDLMMARDAVRSGAEYFPYHSDKTMCRLYTAEEITTITDAGIAYILYNTTLCNALLTWIRRSESVEEIQGIQFTAEGLPEDLAANMNEVLTAASAL